MLAAAAIPVSAELGIRDWSQRTDEIFQGVLKRTLVIILCKKDRRPAVETRFEVIRSAMTRTVDTSSILRPLVGHTEFWKQEQYEH